MIETFLDYLRHERNYSLLTVQSYGRDLEEFQSYFESIDDGLTWWTVDHDVVRAWMEHLMDKGNRASSVNRKLSALRSFYKYSLTMGFCEKSPVHGIQGPKKDKPLPSFLREREMDELLDEMVWEDDYKNVRARTLILTFYSTGIRLSELMALDDSSVDFSTCEMKVTGKRDKQRIIPFGEELRDALKAYMASRDENVTREDDALFVSSKGERMNRNQVRYEVSKFLAMVTTLKKHTPHVLRHTFATAMLNNEAGLESVKKLLGHESLTTTEVYTHATFEQLKRVYNIAHPRA